MERKVERRLSAVLAVDVVGYSRLMGRDEAGTLRRLKSYRREAVDPALKRHGGRLVKLIGDGALVEFPSVSEGLAAAVEAQGAIAALNDRVPEDERLVFRAGLHLGDIILDGEDIYGDGVNVAARLEAAAPPGGIAVSRSVREAVGDRLPVRFEDRGLHTLKNIDQPMGVFHVAWDAAGWPEPAIAEPGPGWWTRRRVALLVTACAGIILVAAIGMSARSWLAPSSEAPAPLSEEQKPSVAVLAFTNLSSDPGQDYFSDGISEGILTALARSPDLTVIARNSSFAYKGKAVDVTDIGRALGVRYVLEGSVQREDNQIRVTAQLIDARTGGHLWAEKYDRPLGDVFAVQDEISGTIAARLANRIERAEISAARHKPTSDLTAYDAFLRGRDILLRSASKDDMLRARGFLEDAIARDPELAPAYADLAFTYYREIARRWSPERRAEAIADGLRLAERALTLDPSLAPAHTVMGNLVMRSGDVETAMRWHRQAIALNANDPDTHAGLANVLLFMNRAKEAVPLMRRALLLDPLHPPLYDNYMGRALLLSGDFEGAIPYLSECVRRLPNSWSCRQSLATADLYAGRSEAAAHEFSAMLAYFPYKSVAEWRSQSDYRDGPQTKLLATALARLGLPEVAVQDADTLGVR